MRLAACQLPEIIGEPARALASVADYGMAAQRAGAELVCFPEAYLHGYDVSEDHVRRSAIGLESREFEAVLHRLRDLTPILVLGLIERDGSSFFNTAVVIRHGSLVARYRKTHLLGSERTVFEAGTEHTVFELSGETIGIRICADLSRAACVRATAEAGARILVCPCNNMMGEAEAERWRHRHNAIRAQRARESGVWLLSSDVGGRRGSRVSYGPTALIAPDGRVVEQVPISTTGMLVSDCSERAA